ncbi:FANCF protein, partial [Mionectes macconnelli]|nr:FANCF protein [Mionectes macconnelli]
RRGGAGRRSKRGRQGGGMAAVLGRLAELPSLLALSRSALVRHWDPPALDRALEWARYFQHLHDRFRARPQLRQALGRRLRRAQPCPPALGFSALGRCPELLGLALLARRKAAARLLALPRRAGDTEPWARAEAQLLLGRLREEEEQEEEEEEQEGAGRRRWLCGVLERLPPGRAFAVAAAALALLGRGSGGAEGAAGGERDGSGPGGNRESAAGGGCVAGLLLSWLLGNPERFSAFCLCLPGALLASLAGHYPQLSRPYLDLLTGWGSHLHYDPLQGRWVKSCLEKAELSWDELRERLSCLCQGSALLREQTQAALELLKTRDGDFKVRGLSVWTDLLMEVEE